MGTVRNNFKYFFYKLNVVRIDTTYNKRFFKWATSTKMNRYYSKVRKIINSLVTRDAPPPTFDSVL